MNFCVSMPDGSLQEISGRSAEACAIFMADKLPHVEEGEQSGVIRSIRELLKASNPEAHFDVGLFTPSWYVPGWVPDR